MSRPNQDTDKRVAERIRNTSTPSTEQRDRITELEKKLDAVRGLKGFSVPYAPLGEKAVWKSDIEAALKEDE